MTTSDLLQARTHLALRGRINALLPTDWRLREAVSVQSGPAEASAVTAEGETEFSVRSSSLAEALANLLAMLERRRLCELLAQLGWQARPDRLERFVEATDRQDVRWLLAIAGHADTSEQAEQLRWWADSGGESERVAILPAHCLQSGDTLLSALHDVSLA